MNGYQAAPASISDQAVLSVIGAVLGICGLVWLWGGVAGAVFGRGWPGTGGTDLLGVLEHLPAHLNNPAAAWPASSRTKLPGPEGFYAGLALVAAAGAGVVLATRRVAGSLPGRHGARGARWAGGWELGPLRARGTGDGPARLTLGILRARRLYAEQRHAVVVFGPPQSGKSAGVAVPALLEWPGPAVASSIKSDLASATLARRRALGQVFVFDPFGLSGQSSHTWSPLAGAMTWMVPWRWPGGWPAPARSTIGARNPATSGPWRPSSAWRRFCTRQPGLVRAWMRLCAGPTAREPASLMSRSPRRRARPRTKPSWPTPMPPMTPSGPLRARPTGPEAQSRPPPRPCSGHTASPGWPDLPTGCQIRPDALLDESATLYLIGDAKASKLLRPIFLALLGEIVDRAYERATLAGGRLERPLLLCLDEAGNVAPLPNLAEIASTAPSHNIQLVSIFHDLSQARSRYGRGAETVINSHRARLLLPGVADLETLRYFAGLLGDEEIREVTRTTGTGGTTRSSSSRRRPLVAPEALRQLQPDHALLVYGRLAPTQLRLRLWFQDRRLRKLAGPGAR